MKNYSVAISVGENLIISTTSSDNIIGAMQIAKREFLNAVVDQADIDDKIETSFYSIVTSPDYVSKRIMELASWEEYSTENSEWIFDAPDVYGEKILLIITETEIINGIPHIGIPHIDMFEAGADYHRAHNITLINGAFTRNCDVAWYAVYRSEVHHAQAHLMQGIEQMRTAAALPDYAKGMGW